MLVLDATPKVIEVLLAGNVTTTQLPVTSHYVDVTDTTYRPSSYTTATNNTTAVSVVLTVGSGVRQVKAITIYNADTVAATVTVRLKDNATNRILVKVVLAVASTLFYTDGEGFRVMDTNGAIL